MSDRLLLMLALCPYAASVAQGLGQVTLNKKSDKTNLANGPNRSQPPIGQMGPNGSQAESGQWAQMGLRPNWVNQSKWFPGLVHHPGSLDGLGPSPSQASWLKDQFDIACICHCAV